MLTFFYVNLTSGVFRKSCVKHETLQKMRDANATVKHVRLHVYIKTNGTLQHEKVSII